jgi:hypothetical protein
LSVRIVPNDSGSIDEIHVLTTNAVAPKQTVRNIESALIAQLGWRVNHRKISIATTLDPMRASDTPASGIPAQSQPASPSATPPALTAVQGGAGQHAASSAANPQTGNAPNFGHQQQSVAGQFAGAQSHSPAQPSQSGNAGNWNAQLNSASQAASASQQGGQSQQASGQSADAAFQGQQSSGGAASTGPQASSGSGQRSSQTGSYFGATFGMGQSSGSREGVRRTPAGGSDAANARRTLLFEDVEVRRSRTRGVLCRVTLSKDQIEFFGEAEGPDTERSRVELAARAAVQAIIEAARVVPGGERGLGMEGAKIIEAFDRSYIFVSLAARIGRDTMVLTGSCEIRDSAETSAVLAVLDATNRWMHLDR